MGSQNISTYGNTQLLDYLTTLHFTVVVVVVYINTRKTTLDFNFDFYQKREIVKISSFLNGSSSFRIKISEKNKTKF